MPLPLPRPLALLACAALSACGGGSGVGSVGAVFTRDSETRTLVVREAPASAAAGRAGLLAGDQVLMIDGLYVRDMSSKDVRARLRGAAGSTVRPTVVRGEDEVHHVQVRRGEMGERRPPPPREERIAE
jgi:C-terminal processing protease CtpA/Prc